MKHLILILLLAFTGANAHAQSMTYFNDDSTLKAMKVKKLSTWYYTAEDTTKSKGQLLFRRVFDKSGKMLSKYVYTFWDVVSYAHTTTYVYNEKGALAEETTIQEILNLGPRDDEYIKMFGAKGSNKKIRYYYNEKGQLIKEERFDYEKELAANASADKTITYEYKEGRLIKEISTSNSVTDQYTTTYEYDARNNRTRALTKYSAEDIGEELVEYTYDAKNRLSEEKITYSQMIITDSHTRHEYNEQGKITNTWAYSKDSNDWVLSASNVYDKDGKLVKRDGKTAISYYPNGLVHSELRKSDDGKEATHFVTRYEFY